MGPLGTLPLDWPPWGDQPASRRRSSIPNVLNALVQLGLHSTNITAVILLTICHELSTAQLDQNCLIGAQNILNALVQLGLHRRNITAVILSTSCHILSTAQLDQKAPPVIPTFSMPWFSWACTAKISPPHRSSIQAYPHPMQANPT